uniref:HAT C-terminal dimerisation domain-containing protein n=1 Tax=Lates calcarifer TaxID=8187 RepID=A0A4W6D5G1_LATCA
MNISSKKSTAVAENATAASYEVAKLIAQHGKPFSDGDFIKQCLIKVDLSAKKEKYVSVIASLVTEFNQRFQDFSVNEKQIKLFSTPFLVDAEEVEESLQLELIEMQCDDSLKSQHQLLSLPDFYQSLDNAKFPLMRRHAKRMMSLFGSTFSLLNQNKSRLRTRMTDSHLCEVLRVSTTKLSPDMSAILQSRGQHHCSH